MDMSRVHTASVFTIIVLVLPHFAGSQENYTTPIEEILDRLFEQNNYNRNIRPRVNMDETTYVAISIYVQSLSSFSEIRMEYAMDIYFRQAWNDPRLQFNDTDEFIIAGPNYASKLWLPDPYFMNSKTETFHTVTVPNILLRIYPNGDVYFSQRLSLTLACNMMLEKFPMDVQMCDVRVMSYGYTTRHITLTWVEDSAVETNTEIELPEFSLERTEIGDCTQSYVSGTYSCLVARFHVARRISFYLVQTYIPTILIVVLSWVNFWIDPRATPARVSLGLLCVLTMTTQSSGVRSQLPRVSYIKSMDVWLNSCLVFVFGALLEYAIVNVQARKCDVYMKKRSRSYEENDVKENGHTDSPDKEMEGKLSSSPNGKVCLTPERVDIISRFLFPFAFAGFNIAYWVVYRQTDVW